MSTGEINLNNFTEYEKLDGPMIPTADKNSQLQAKGIAAVIVYREKSIFHTSMLSTIS